VHIHTEGTVVAEGKIAARFDATSNPCVAPRRGSHSLRQTAWRRATV
jgi:hypothetical protein